MKSIFLSILYVLLTYTLSFAQAFAVTFPTNTSLTAPHTMYSYTDTTNGKIVMNGWPYAGNIIINSFNVSNGNYPCGTSVPFPASKTVYLKDMYSGAGYTLCFASGPLPDTIKYEIREANGTVLENIFFVVNPDAAPLKTNDYDKVMLNIYPNPANDKLHVLVEESIYIASILDLEGRMVIQKEISPNDNSMNIFTLPSGIYILKLTDVNKNVYVRKFVKE